MRPELVVTIQLALMTTGLVLWVVALARGRALEWFTGSGRLPPWVILPLEFLLLLVAVAFAWVLGVEGTTRLFQLDMDADPIPGRTYLLRGLGMQLATMAVILVFRSFGGLRPPPGPTPPLPAAMAGFGALLLMLPGLALASIGWKWVVKVLDLPGDAQASIEIIRQASGPAELAGWFVLVVLVAPVAEELLFRNGIYRFLSGRVPEVAAIGVSAVLFAGLHGNAVAFGPLVLLGIALSLAYRYTGRLITAIVLHGLFNFNSLVMVLLGIEP